MQFLQKFDFEGRTFDFYLPNGDRYQKTTSGGFIFILVILVFILYASVRFQVLMDRSDYNVLESSF